MQPNLVKGKQGEGTSESSAVETLRKEDAVAVRKTPPTSTSAEVSSDMARRVRQAQQKQLKERWRKQFIGVGEKTQASEKVQDLDADMELLSNG